MDSPAARLERVLIGIAIPMAFLTALAIAEGRIELFGCDEDSCAGVDEISLALPGIVILCLVGVVLLRTSKNRNFG